MSELESPKLKTAGKFESVEVARAKNIEENVRTLRARSSAAMAIFMEKWVMANWPWLWSFVGF